MTENHEPSDDEALAARMMLRAYRPDWGAESLTRIANERLRRLVAEAAAILTAMPQTSVRVLDFVAYWSDAGRAGLAPKPGAAAAILTAAAHWTVPEDYVSEYGEPMPALPSSEVLAALTGFPLAEVCCQLARLRRLGILQGGPRSARGERFGLRRMEGLMSGAPWSEGASERR